MLFLPLFPSPSSLPYGKNSQKKPATDPPFSCLSQEFSSSTESLDKSLAPVSSVPVPEAPSSHGSISSIPPLWNCPAFPKYSQKNPGIATTAFPTQNALGMGILGKFSHSGWDKIKENPPFPTEIHPGMRRFPLFRPCPLQVEEEMLFPWNLAPKILGRMGFIRFFFFPLVFFPPIIP